LSVGIRQHVARTSLLLVAVAVAATLQETAPNAADHSNAHVRFFGSPTLRMTYVYSHIDGRHVVASMSTP